MMPSLPARRVLAAIVAILLVAVVLALRNGAPFLNAVPSVADSVASPSSGTVSSAPVGSGSAAGPIDTSGWQQVRVHSLGFSLRLPPTFELVGDDPAHPVPSFDAISKVAAPIASGLQDQSRRLASAPGVFGELGAWAIEPDSLSQVGLLAGRPYRVAEADLQGIVQAAVAARATPLEGSAIDVIELPAGNGYLASYRDAVELGGHLEIHLRTPTGRYMVLVMTLLTASADRATESRFLAVAGTLAPLEGTESGDIAAPPSAPDGHADAALEALLPASLGGVALQIRSLNGEELVGGDIGTGTVLDAVGSLVPAPGRVTVAVGAPSSGSNDVLLTAFRLDGVDPSAIQLRVADFPPQIWSHASISGRDVLASVPGSDGRRTYLRVSGNVIEEVVSGDAALAAGAIAGLK